MKQSTSLKKQPTFPPPPPMEDKFFAKVRAIIVSQLGVDEAAVTPEARFAEDLGADSLDTVELVMAFEEAFDIAISDEEAEELVTVQNAVEYLHGKVKHKVER